MTELIQHEPTQDVIAQSVAAKVTNITKKQINATLTCLTKDQLSLSSPDIEKK